MASPRSYRVAASGEASAAPSGAVPINLYGSGTPIEQAPAQADSAATDVAGIVADHNALLAKLRTAGVLAS